MSRITRILVWPLVAFLSLIVCAVFVVATVGAVIELFKR